MAKKNSIQVNPSPATADSRAYTEATIPRPDKPVPGTIRILIADDHTVMRQGLSISLNQEPDMAIVGEAADGMAALKKTRILRPDVVLMDPDIPQMNGIEATRKIHSEMPEVRVIGLSIFEESELASAMLEAGAATYLGKKCTIDELTAAIRRCMSLSEVHPESSVIDP